MKNLIWKARKKKNKQKKRGRTWAGTVNLRRKKKH